MIKTYIFLFYLLCGLSLAGFILSPLKAKPKCTHIYVAVEKEEAYARSLTLSPKTIVCVKCYNITEQTIKPAPANPYPQFWNEGLLNRADSLHVDSLHADSLRLNLY